jgi:outer membrane protein assembly factor BamB
MLAVPRFGGLLGHAETERDGGYQELPMRRLAGLFFLLIPVCLAGCAPSGGEFAGLVQPEVLAKADLRYYWHVRLTLERGDEVARMYLLGDRLYCLTNHNRLLALDAARGIWLWSQVLAAKRQPVFAPVHVERVSIPGRLRIQLSPEERASSAKPFDAVILNTLTEILVLDRSTGELVSRIPFDFPASTGGTIDSTIDAEGRPTAAEHYILASSRGWYYGITLNTGLQAWGMSTGGFIIAAPVFHNGILYVAAEDNVLYASRVGRHALAVWNSLDLDSQQMHGPVSAAIHADARGVFVPCQDNRLYAFNRLTGKPLWEPYVCQQPLLDDVQVGENSIFQLVRRDGFYAIDITNGTKRWSSPDGVLVLAVVKDKTSQAYLLDQNRNIRVVEEMTGKVNAVLPMIALERFLPNTTVPAIYAATRKGHVVCIRPGAAGYLTPEVFRQRP